MKPSDMTREQLAEWLDEVASDIDGGVVELFEDLGETERLHRISELLRQPVEHPGQKIIRDQAATLSIHGDDVHINCENREQAMQLYEWLESYAGKAVEK